MTRTMISDCTCPACGIKLDTAPSRKKKCPSCKQFIYVRTVPVDRKQYLVTEDEIEIIESDAEFILVIEKSAAMMDLAEVRFWRTYPCILLTAQGVGNVATRMFLKRLTKELNLPAFTLVDSDPYGHYIHSVYLRGSKRLSYETPFLATPNIKLLGVLTRDLDTYKIKKDVRLRMTKQDLKRANDMLKEDFVKKNKKWEEDIKLSIKLKTKAEIQAFSSKGIDFLTETYLPEKLTTGDWI